MNTVSRGHLKFKGGGEGGKISVQLFLKRLMNIVSKYLKFKGKISVFEPLNHALRRRVQVSKYYHNIIMQFLTIHQ